MNMVPRSRRLARLAGCTVLTLGLVGLTAAASAQARVTVTPVVSRVVASWGDNTVGQLGDGTTVLLRTLYRDIAAGSDVVQVAAGRTHNLALRSDGTVLAWGLGVRGQLGNGIQTQVSGPVQVTNMGGATQVAAGQLASYAVHTVLVLTGQSS
jgi:Regulator of chromosome condensation (RCC1) repeat